MPIFVFLVVASCSPFNLWSTFPTLIFHLKHLSKLTTKTYIYLNTYILHTHKIHVGELFHIPTIPYFLVFICVKSCHYFSASESQSHHPIMSYLLIYHDITFRGGQYFSSKVQSYMTQNKSQHN